ncbi:MAG: YggT family protein [Caulobacteraceae bacterium]
MGLFLYKIIDGLLGLLSIAIIAAAVMSWLIAFNVMNDRHPIVRQIERFLWAVTRPVLWPLQKVIPPLGTVDVTPIIALLIIQAARSYLLPWLFRPIVGVLGG